MYQRDTRFRPASPFRAGALLCLLAVVLVVGGCGLWDHDHNGGGLVSALPQPSVNCDGSSCID